MRLKPIAITTSVLALAATLAFKFMANDGENIIEETNQSPSQDTALQQTSSFSTVVEPISLNTSEEESGTTQAFEEWIASIEEEEIEEPTVTETIEKCFSDAIQEMGISNDNLSKMDTLTSEGNEPVLATTFAMTQGDYSQQVTSYTTQDKNHAVFTIEIMGERASVSYIPSIDTDQSTHLLHLNPQLEVKITVPFTDAGFPTVETFNPNASLDNTQRATDSNAYYDQMAQMHGTADTVTASMQYCLTQ